MERTTKCKPDNLCMAICTICLAVRFIEYFLIEADKTVIGENVLHKVVGIIISAISSTSADELHIIRIMVAQLLSFTFVLATYCRRNKKQTGKIL